MEKTLRMSWPKLLSAKRVLSLQSSCEVQQVNRQPSQFTDIARSEYERDSDQITYSSQFRRLQDKTQVIPFPEFDFVHTRLTHTLEVASVGRSLGYLAGRFIKQTEEAGGEKLPDTFINDVSETARAACLAHDIGNPSFGHSGEDAISCYFEEVFGIVSSNLNLDDPNSAFKIFQRIPELDTQADILVRQKQHYNHILNHNKEVKRQYDLLSFEGNANGFRILTNCKNKALNPTCATLGAFSKYPRESIIFGDSKKEDRKKAGKSQAKYGFFQTERNIFKEVAEELGLLPADNLKEGDLAWKRHPLAFLMEAADDICYQLIDFEDGCRLRLINFNEVYDIPDIGQISPKSILINLAGFDNSFVLEYAEQVIAGGTKPAIAYLRSKVINVLTYLVFEAFKKNYEGIMTGSFDKALIDTIDEDAKKNLKAMEWLIRDKVYTYEPVLESEAAGFKVIAGLLKSFGETAQLCKTCEGTKKENAHQRKLLALLPKKYRPKPEETPQILDLITVHSRYLDIIDYVSGMTDGFAISLYRKVEGIALPEIR